MRRRITERLLEAAGYPITVVIAPGGFGKTVAIRHFLEFQEAPIFVSTPRAVTLEQFVHVFAVACSPLIPDIAAPSDESINRADEKAHLDLYLAWATKHLQQLSCTVAIDDFQNADDTPSIANLLSQLTTILNTNIKWIFSTRTHGSLPIARWQGYGYADAPIVASDLQISIDDAVDIAAALKSSASIEQLQALIAQTDGFPISVAYAIRLSARKGSIASIVEDARSFTFGFLAEQLWASLPISHRALLETAAFLTPIHMHAYESGGHEQASSIISNLCNDVGFLTLTPDGCFTMHDLFRDFIKLQVSLDGPGRELECVNDAVSILIIAKRYNDAFYLLSEKGRSSDLIDAIERFSTFITDPSINHMVIDATEQLPIEQLGLQTLCLQTEHWSWQGETHKALLYAGEIYRRKDASSKHLLCSYYSFFRAVDDKDPEAQRQWLDWIPEIVGRLNETDQTLAYACQASVLARFPDSQSKAKTLVESVRQKLNTLNFASQIDAQLGLANALFYLGNNAAALHCTREAVTVANATKNLRSVARSLNSLGVMLGLVCDPEVESIFEPLRDAIEKTGLWRYSVTSHCDPAQYYAWKGDLDEAVRTSKFQEAIIPSSESRKAYLGSIRRHSLNLCRLLTGDFGAILADFGKSGLPKERDVAYDILGEAAIAHAFSSNFSECEALLKRIKQLRESAPPHIVPNLRVTLLFEIIALCAIGHWSLARRLNEQYRGATPGLAQIEEALSIFCQGPPFIGLSEILDRCLGRPYVGLLAVLMKRMIASAQYRSESPLSTSEIDVLRLLALGKSNKEIANARSRSPETVKRQVGSIYKKLLVDNRTSAVAIARERGLLK